MTVAKILALVTIGLTSTAIALLAASPASARPRRHHSRYVARYVPPPRAPYDLRALGGGLKNGALAAGGYEYDAGPYGYAYGYPTLYSGFGYFPDNGRRPR